MKDCLLDRPFIEEIIRTFEALLLSSTKAKIDTWFVFKPMVLHHFFNKCLFAKSLLCGKIHGSTGKTGVNQKRPSNVAPMSY